MLLTVLVAIPSWRGWVSPVFDVAARLLVVRVQSGKEVARQEAALAETRPERLVAQLAELGVNVLICGAISQPLACCLAKVGVRVWPHVCGEADAVVRAYLTHTLDRPEFRMPGCSGGHCGWRHGHRPRRGNPWRNEHKTKPPTP